MDILQFEAGPWKKIIDSNFEGFPVYIYQNPNKWVLVVIFEQENGQTKNLITQIYAPFTGPISLTDLSNKIKADSIAYTKNISGKTFNYLIINSGITSIPFSSAEFKANVKEQVTAIKENIRQVKDVAKTAEIALHSINTANEETAANLFGEPILSAILSTSTEVRIRHAAVNGSILIGVDLNGKKVEEPPKAFLKTLITGQNATKLLQTAQVLTEGVLMSALPMAIFDWDGSFSGLSLPSENTSNYAKFQINAAPTGFPIKSLIPPKEIHINLNYYPIEQWDHVLGFSNSISGEILAKTIEENQGKITTLGSIKSALESKVTEKTGFEVYRAIRVVNLTKLMYGPYMDGGIPVNEIISPWIGNVGRAGIINLRGLPVELIKDLTHSTLASILKKFKKEGPTSNVKAVILLPNAEKLVPKNPDPIQAEMINILKELPKYGISWILTAQNSVDISPSLNQELDAELNWVSGDEIGVRHATGRPYRAKLRPTFSRFAGTNLAIPPAEKTVPKVQQSKPLEKPKIEMPSPKPTTKKTRKGFHLPFLK